MFLEKQQLAKNAEHERAVGLFNSLLNYAGGYSKIAI